MRLRNGFFIFLMLFVFCASVFLSAEDFKTIQLNKPSDFKKAALIQALKDRRSGRDFINKELTLQQLSDILWAANGINRKDGKRTSPAAMGKQMVDIYAVTADGVYLYDAEKNTLEPVAEGDFRAKTGMQPFTAVAALNLVYVADPDRFGKMGNGHGTSNEDIIKMAAIAAGCMVQNVYLYSAAEGLGCVIRGSIKQETFGPVIKVKGKQTILCAQSVGNIK